MTLYHVHVDDPQTDAAVDRPDQVGGGQGEVAAGEAVTGGHHQGGEGGVGQVTSRPSYPRLGTAVVEETLLVSAVGADHDEEPAPLVVPAGEVQAGGGAGQAGPEGGGPALVRD